MFREGLLVVISGPSGTGKGTLLSAVKKFKPDIQLSVSATTREPRTGETDGVNYYFRTREEFLDMIKRDELVEWDEYCENFYGTPRKHIDDNRKLGYDVVLEITVEGALSIKDKYPDSVLIFILPPSFDELSRRITGRGTEAADVIDKRLNKACKEMQLLNRYDYVVINNDIQTAVDDIISILNAEKLKCLRNKNILDHIGIKTEV